ncbi:MAG: hypothetical protein IJ667_02875 [Synergistaceae bacterium]|nr:hypothetical protein [Synergistaceae bacterium]
MDLVKDIRLEENILRYDGGEINLPDGCMFDEQIFKPELLLDAFKFLRQELKIKNINLILPDKGFVIKQVFYPASMPFSEVQQAISYDLDKYFIELMDYSSPNVNLRDDLVYEVKYDSNNNLIAAAAAYKPIAGVLAAAESAGLKVNSIQPENYNYFDLRTPAYKTAELKRRKLTIEKLIALASLTFFLGANLIYIFTAVKNIIRLENLINFERSPARVQAREAQIEKIKYSRSWPKRVMNFILDQPPLLEVLFLLTINFIHGVNIHHIRFYQDGKIYKAEVNASCSQSSLATKFIENLDASASSEFVSKISVPMRTRDHFTVIMELKSYK